MQFHQGTRLKKIISNKKIEYDLIIEKTGMSRSTFFRMLNQEQIKYKVINVILKIIGVEIPEFYSDNLYKINNVELQRELEALKSENEALKNDVIQLSREARENKKTNKKTRVVA
jgi:predicted RNase H-like nuclease (RuvC/YqgF family)